MLLIAVRHGETEWNLQGREMGQLDSPLTRRGIRQAEALGRRLAAKIDQLYSSDLGRALHTARIIGAMSEKAVNVEPGLRERHMGLFQGLTWQQIGVRFPEERAAYERSGFFDTVPDGETAQERQNRSVQVLTDIAARHLNETVAVVTHGGFLMGFLEFVLGLPFGGGKRIKKQNASFNAFEYLEGHWRLGTWNDVSHLDGLSSLSPFA
jgi:broad specificity phosphatase PhoE